VGGVRFQPAQEIYYGNCVTTLGCEMEQKLQMISISDNSLFSIVYHTEYKREKGNIGNGGCAKRKDEFHI
jgi:hypothetical protein